VVDDQEVAGENLEQIGVSSTHNRRYLMQGDNSSGVEHEDDHLTATFPVPPVFSMPDSAVRTELILSLARPTR
jgi:hypothetical protein